ncbi:unnamed protein product [Rotaria sp. Silwood2]|nr:unnamed protein product [Rotaria sp. Silwood2]CAF4593077.1 unnamed protein product [Rotaria sp. Silwood2]CAF4606427.1 unnamed protein product [Rotaria sp. Silwood2]
MPGKRDTIVVNDDGNKITYQKRIMLYTIREAYELFLIEHPGPSCIRSNQTAIRPRHQQEILIKQEHKNIYQKSSTPSQ